MNKIEKVQEPEKVLQDITVHAANQSAHSSEPQVAEKLPVEAPKEEARRTQEVTLPDGRREKTFPDGRREINFPNGLKKILWGDGRVSVVFPNGDRKESLSDGTVVYH